jgi:hypothetical protein
LNQHFSKEFLLLNLSSASSSLPYLSGKVAVVYFSLKIKDFCEPLFVLLVRLLNFFRNFVTPFHFSLAPQNRKVYQKATFCLLALPFACAFGSGER